MMTNVPELNLNDPNTVEKLKSVDVMKATPKADEVNEVALEKKIRGLRSASTFKLKLNADQMTRIERDAASAGYKDWQSYLQHLIDTKIFDGQIGAPVITKPSFAKQVVTGPSLWN
jgi:predicted RNase H-like nuclease (RuvC/YqgF family)